MLDTTLNGKFVPGTNLSGGLARADWRFLLPSLKCERFLCLGVPPASALKAFATTARLVVVVSRNYSALQNLLEKCKESNISNLKMMVANSAALPFANNSFDLIYSTKEKDEPDIFSDKKLAPELGRLLQPKGVIYSETEGFASYSRSNGFFANGLKATQAFWLTPFSGKMRTALPVQDHQIADYFFNNVIFGNSSKKRAASVMGKTISRVGLLRYFTPRRAALIRPNQTSNGRADSFAYLVSLAGRAGIDLSGYRFGVYMRGQGNSNKVIFYLFDQNSRKPKFVIKMTRDPQFNCCLENEYRMLSLLKERQFIDVQTYPEPLFFDYHNNLAVLGMRAIEGEPLRSRTKATSACPMALDAIARIAQLGTSSADNSVASPKEVSATLFKLFGQFNQIYKLSDDHRRFLARQIEKIARNRHAFPLVVQHGDPGTWNMFVSKQGKVILIDWESGERQGMPLWDLFYFLRTYASWVSRKQGCRDSLTSFAKQFLKPSSYLVLLQDVTQRYAHQISLAEELIEPLFYTCWMHRALKEAARLTTDQLEGGHYLNLLRLTIDQRNSLVFVKKQPLPVNALRETVHRYRP
ncbi:MAG TPA: phosphotransferase [Terriglobia bacterium]|nr:phosphotransferase [Terriglobia bacterium]